MISTIKNCKPATVGCGIFSHAFSARSPLQARRRGQSVIDALTSSKRSKTEVSPHLPSPHGCGDASVASLRHASRWHRGSTRLYLLCVRAIARGLSRRDVFVSPSVRYADPRLGLLQGAAWEAARPMICRSLGHPADAQEAVSLFRAQLDQTYRTVAANFPHNPAVRIESCNGKDRLVLSPLDKLDEPPSLSALRAAIAAPASGLICPICCSRSPSERILPRPLPMSAKGLLRSGVTLSPVRCCLPRPATLGLSPWHDPDIPALHRTRLTGLIRIIFATRP